MPFREGVSSTVSGTASLAERRRAVCHRVTAGGALFAIAGALTIGACVRYEKSQNPLSPTLAGPLPGITITQPNPVQPNQNSRIPVDQQPVTLMVDNASTNSVRPLSYRFEVAGDGDFFNMVFTREGIQPGNGRTSLRLPEALPSQRLYFWRARGQDGANTGPYSAVGTFQVFTPVVLGKPVAVAPANDVSLSNAHPAFTIGNAPRSGPVGAITYTIELSSSAAFSPLSAIWQVGEQPNTTTLNAPADLPGGTQFFWHVRASDPGNLGPYSDTQSFKTPAAAPPPAPPGGGGGGAPCLANTAESIVQCERSKYGFMSRTDLVNFLRATATDLNQHHISGGPFGILPKTSGNQCNGYSCDIICNGSLQGWDVLGDVDNTQTPQWSGPIGVPSGCQIQPGW